MNGSKLLLAVAAIMALVAAIRYNDGRIEQVPVAMVALANKTRACVGGLIRHDTLSFACKTPVRFADFRKLDMRADHRVRGQSAGTNILQVRR